jgi:hypothetical protein
MHTAEYTNHHVGGKGVNRGRGSRMYFIFKGGHVQKYNNYLGMHFSKSINNMLYTIEDSWYS